MLKVKLDASARIGRDALYSLPPELLALLRSIRQHGSLVRAVSDVRISYRHAWALIGRWEPITGHKLAILTRGQGTGLTAFGARFADIGDWLDANVYQRFDGLCDGLAHYLDVPRDSGAQRVQLHASHDIRLLKLKDRLEQHLASDLHFEDSLNSLDSMARGDCDIAGFHLPQPPTLLGSLLAEFGARLNAREHCVGLLPSRHQRLVVGKEYEERTRSEIGRHDRRQERVDPTKVLEDKE